MIVVTGAAGFIGSNIVAALNEAGHTDLVLCDRLGCDDKWRNLSGAVFRDLVAPEQLVGWLSERRDVDAVIHMGAISSTTAADGDEMFEVNVRLPTRLLERCADAGVPFLYASSAAVYGDRERDFDDSAAPADIAALRPLNLYGWSKRQFDHVVATRAASGAMMPPQWVGFRFFNVFGPHEQAKGDMRSLVAKIIGPVRRGEQISLFRSHRAGVADGEQCRDFIYVKDAVAVVLWFLANPHISGLFNVGTGRARSFRALAEAVFAAVGHNAGIAYVDMPSTLRDRYQYHTCASLRNLRRAGFDSDFMSLEESVLDYTVQQLRSKQ